MHIHHHEKRTITTNLIVIPLFIAILAGVTIFNRPIRRLINIPKKMVEGTHDGNFQDLSKENFTKALAEDTKAEVDTLKDTVLDTTIRDLVNFLGRSDKILKDVDQLQKQAGEVVNSVDPFTNGPQRK